MADDDLIRQRIVDRAHSRIRFPNHMALSMWMWLDPVARLLKKSHHVHVKDQRSRNLHLWQNRDVLSKSGIFGEDQRI